MALSLATAKQLCTKSELELFSRSLMRNVRSLDKRSLKSLVSRSRKLRDKYKKLADRQDREARGKQKPRRANPSRGSVATRKKQKLFAEALARFEKQFKLLESAEVKAAKEAKKQSKPRRKASAGTTAAKKTRARKTTFVKNKSATKSLTATIERGKKPKRTSSGVKTAALSKAARVKASGKSRRVRHLSAATRRRQARRDVR